MNYEQRLRYTNNEYWAAFETHVEFVVELEAVYGVPGYITQSINQLMIDAIDHSRKLEALLAMPRYKRFWYKITNKEI